MSPDRDQRKQELLIRLSESRLGVIDEAEALRNSIRNSFSWLRPAASLLSGKRAGAISLGAALAGLLLARGAGKLFFPSHHHSRNGGQVPGDTHGSSLMGILKTTLVSILTASLVPALKQAVQQSASRKISDLVGKYLSR